LPCLKKESVLKNVIVAPKWILAILLTGIVHAKSINFAIIGGGNASGLG